MAASSKPVNFEKELRTKHLAGSNSYLSIVQNVFEKAYFNIFS